MNGKLWLFAAALLPICLLSAQEPSPQSAQQTSRLVFGKPSSEAEALRQVFGAGKVPPLSSTKGATGHALGAAGAIEAVATVMAMREGVAPPTANFDEVDPECDIDVIPNLARSMPIETALSNSFAFGGLNASLALRRFA